MRYAAAGQTISKAYKSTIAWSHVQAIRLDPSQPLAHLGTAQVYLAAGGEVTNVVSELELVLKALPGEATHMQTRYWITSLSRKFDA